MKIAIGCDHGAFALKNKIIQHLEKQEKAKSHRSFKISGYPLLKFHLIAHS